MLFPMLVIFPSPERDLDILLLTFLRSTAQKDDDLCAVFAKVHPVSWAKVDPELKNAASNSLHV